MDDIFKLKHKIEDQDVIHLRQVWNFVRTLVNSPIHLSIKNSVEVFQFCCSVFSMIAVAPLAQRDLLWLKTILTQHDPGMT